MAHVVPAIRGKMGNTEYFQATVPARELVSSARPAAELDEWAGWSIEERLQRELNEKRVDASIVPYLAQAEDRFFGSVIVLVYKGELTFEPIESVGTKVPAAYRSVAQDIGFLTIDGGELILLDGQHRLVALRHVIQGKFPGPCVPEVPGDDISVIFIRFENAQKTRRIFNKVNRNAKPTSRADNIITSEDDGYAIVTRWLLDPDHEGPLAITYVARGNEPELIVNWKSNTIPPRALQITTISAVNETVKDILEASGIKDFDEKSRVNRPPDPELEQAYGIAADWWRAVLNGLTPFKETLADPIEKNLAKVPEMREESKPYSLIFKPIGTIVLFKGMARAMARASTKKGLSLSELVSRVDRVDWSISSAVWRDILVRPSGAVMAQREQYDIAADLVAYFVAPEFTTKDQKEALWRVFNRLKGYDFADPEPDTQPIDLPAPVTEPVAA